MSYIITDIAIESNYKIRLNYSNGSTIIVDFMPIIQQGGIFSSLENPELFKQAKIGDRGRHIEWINEIDFCADALWFQVYPQDNKFTTVNLSRSC